MKTASDRHRCVPSPLAARHSPLATGAGVLLTLAALMAIVLGVCRLLSLWQLSFHVELAGREIATGQLESARARLTWLSGRWPRDPTVNFQLGFCHHALGDPDGALAALSRVPAGVPESDRATLLRARTLIEERGRFSEAERLLEPLGRSSPPTSAEARQWLIRLYYWEGRPRDIRRLLELEWSRGRYRAALLRESWRLDADPPFSGMIQDTLDRAANQSPGDERVWLGRANLAIRSGKLAEAARWLDRCLERGPDDTQVWRSRLDWALVADRADVARAALSHLPADALSPAEVLELRAWAASRLGERTQEQSALEQWVDLDPGASQALERLTHLALEGRKPERAAELRRRKAALDASRERYRQLLAVEPRMGTEEELGRIAEALGRWFEARGWYMLAMRRGPSRVALREARDRIERRMTPLPRDRVPGQSLDDLITVLDGVQPARQGPDLASSAPGSIPRFRDDASVSGLLFTYQSGRSPAHHLPETMGGGAALLDYDGDGWLDVYLVQGGVFPPGPRPRRRPMVIDCSEIEGTAASKTSRPASVLIVYREAMATAWPWAITTTTGTRTFSSPAGGPMPCSAMTGRDSWMRRRLRGWAATATGRPPRRSPTWMATATWTSSSATILTGIPTIR